MMLTRASLYVFSSTDPTAFGRTLAAAGQEHPVYFDEGIGMPVVLRGAEVTAALKDPATFSTRVYDQGLMKGALVSLVGDAHARMRRLYNSFFAPRALARYEEQIIGPIVRRVLDDLATKERADLIDDFATPIPIGVVSALFGLPTDSIAENDHRVRAMLRSLVRPRDAEVVAAGWQAYGEIADQLREIAAREIASPSDNLLGEVARSLIAEGMGTTEECERVVFTLILGSYETTIWMLVSAIGALLANPDATAQVRQDPSLVPTAIDEATRWASPTVGLVRFVERDTELAGAPLEAGSLVYLSLIASHYDPTVYPDPARYDVRRRSTPMLFGLGPHYCVGAPLARMEARLAVSQLLARFPALRADPTRPPVYSTSPRGAVTYGPDHLPALLT
jgi:cytochrome P450